MSARVSWVVLRIRVLAGPAVLACVAAASAAAATPVAGSVFGPVTSTKGSTFVVKTSLSPTGSSKVSVVSGAAITEQVTAPRSGLKVGACVSALGSRNAKGVVAATRVSLTAAVKGQCESGFRPGGGSGPGGRPPGSGAPPGPGTQSPPGGFGGNASFGFAFGTVTKLKGETLTVHGTRGSTMVNTTVTVSSKTQLLETAHVPESAITTKMCAFVDGTSTDKGVTIKAQTIMLSKQTRGTCTNGFRRR